MTKKIKVKNILSSIFLFLAVVLCVIVIAQIMSKGYVTIFGHSLFKVATGSMEPTIETGALLISEETDIESVKVDDIICFRSKEAEMLGQVITHRVVSIGTDDEGKLLLETRGDANSVSDVYYVTEENFIGSVSNYTKEGSIIAGIYGAVSTRQGFLAFIVLPVLLIAGLILSSSVKNIQKELAELSKVQSLQKKQEQMAATGKTEEGHLTGLTEIDEELRDTTQEVQTEKSEDENPDMDENEDLESRLKGLMSEDEYSQLLARLKEDILEEVEKSAEETGDNK